MSLHSFNVAGLRPAHQCLGEMQRSSAGPPDGIGRQWMQSKEDPTSCDEAIFMRLIVKLHLL